MKGPASNNNNATVVVVEAREDSATPPPVAVANGHGAKSVVSNGVGGAVGNGGGPVDLLVAPHIEIERALEKKLRNLEKRRQKLQQTKTEADEKGIALTDIQREALSKAGEVDQQIEFVKEMCKLVTKQQKLYLRAKKLHNDKLQKEKFDMANQTDVAPAPTNAIAAAAPVVQNGVDKVKESSTTPVSQAVSPAPDADVKAKEEPVVENKKFDVANQTDVNAQAATAPVVQNGGDKVNGSSTPVVVSQAVSPAPDADVKAKEEPVVEDKKCDVANQTVVAPALTNAKAAAAPVVQNGVDKVKESSTTPVAVSQAVSPAPDADVKAKEEPVVEDKKFDGAEQNGGARRPHYARRPQYARRPNYAPRQSDRGGAVDKNHSDGDRRPNYAPRQSDRGGAVYKNHSDGDRRPHYAPRQSDRGGAVDRNHSDGDRRPHYAPRQSHGGGGYRQSYECGFRFRTE